MTPPSHETRPSSALPRDHYDVIIVGAGIAGCAAARALSVADRTGTRSILLIDLHADVAPKFSGEFIHPRGAQVLDDLGFYGPLKAAGAVDARGFVVLEDAVGRRVDLDYDSLPASRHHGLSVHHKTLVRVMRRHVRETCANVDLAAPFRMLNVIQPGGPLSQVRGVRVRDDRDGHEYDVTADLVVAADGKASPTRKSAGIPDEREPLGFTAGIELQHSQSPSPLHAVVVLGAIGPVLCYPIESRDSGRELVHRVTFDIPGRLPVKGREVANYLIDSFVPYLPSGMATECATVLREHARHGKLEIAPTVNLPAPPATMPGLVLIGDAAGCSHPITASGMTMGLLDAAQLGDQAREANESRQPWLGPRQIDRFRVAHDRYVPTRQAVADGIYECMRGETEGARAIRRALFDYWDASQDNRTRSLALLACSERRARVFLSEYARTAKFALSESLWPSDERGRPWTDRVRRIRGSASLAGGKLGAVGRVMWVNMRPSWVPRRTSTTSR